MAKNYRYPSSSIFLLIGLFFYPILLCYGADKNGVAPNTVSLPSGPGSIEGLGSSFQPMLNSGNARYTVPIAVPSGTAGHAPSLSLQYDSGLGDGSVGIGWSIGPGSITRQTDKGIPRYVDGPNGVDDDYDGTVDNHSEQDTFVGPDGEELVQVAENVFRARIEGAFVRYRRVDNYWLADLKNGATLEFGKTAIARITDSSGEKIFRWLLQRSTDPNGNVIDYTYVAFSGSDNNKYLREIRYGPGPSSWTTFYFINFNYESRPDWRKDYRSGFLVKTSHRLKQIDIGIQGSLPLLCSQGDWNGDKTADGLISRYLLDYTPRAPVTSQLSRVTRYGSDGVNQLPPITFGYSTTSPVQPLSADRKIITGVNTPSLVMDNELVELVDLNRDGLTDILQTDYTGSSHGCYLNFGPTEDYNSAPIIWSDRYMMISEDGSALPLHLDEDRVSLADMDGDGLADLVHKTELDEIHFYLNQGDLSWGSEKTMSTQAISPPAPYSSKDVTTADINFDKRIDVVKSTDSGYSIWLNIEDGKYSSELRTAGASYMGRVLLFSTTGTQTADMNGDRLTDVIRITSGEIIYGAGLGYGNFADAVSIVIPDMMLTDGSNGQISRAKLTDINSDGLADLVVERAVANELWFWLNLGTDTLSKRYVVSGMPVLFGTDTAVRWADMNGNGTTDLVYADSFAADRLRILDIGTLINESGHPNLLTIINNGLGVVTVISYRSSTEFYLEALEKGDAWLSTIPFPVQVVSGSKVTTGLDLDNVPGLDMYLKKYSYRDGFYEDREKQFRGFARVRVTEHGDASAPTKITQHEFFTGGPDGVDNDGDSVIDEISTENHREEDALKGMLLAVQSEAEDGSIFRRRENNWSVRTLLTSTDNIEVRYGYKISTDNIIYEQTDSPETIRSIFVYDDFGNVTEQRNLGALSISGDELFSFSEYINNTTNWLLGLPSRNYLTDANLQMAAETLYYYDGDPFIGLPSGQATMGNLTRQQKWESVNDTSNIDYLRNEYDRYGNITAFLDAKGNRRTLLWDSNLHIFPVRENIEVSSSSPDLSVIADYNLGLGVVTSSLDFNSNETTYGHDTFGRLTSISLPGDSAELPTKTFQYIMVDPTEGQIYSYDQQGGLTLEAGTSSASLIATRTREVSGFAGTFDTITYFDGLGRNLGTVGEDEQDFVMTDGVLFNSQGTPHYSFLPYKTPSPEYTPPVMGNSTTEYRYDALGRVVESVNPADSDGLNTSVTSQYQALSSTVIDENNRSKNLYLDGLDRLIRVQEENLGDDYITSYSYDTSGNLTRIVDAQNNSKTMTYDGLGRKTAMEDPDKGHMEYEYDLSGNLSRTLDNKGQETLYTYDKAGRLLTIDYLDAGGISPDISYHYDTSSADYPAAGNLKGRMGWVEDLSGGTFFSFDARGTSDWIVNRIDNNGTVDDYLSSREYDAMGRVTAYNFPDGDRVTYTYNNRSLLESIPGYVDNLDYFATGQRAQLRLSNNITTTYGYDPRWRLNLLKSVNTIDDTLLQVFTYAFNGTSNITQITDNRFLPPDSPKNGSQLFEYDDLQRLTRAEGNGYGAISFQYDKIGNMIFKGSPEIPVDDPLINLGTVIYGGSPTGASNRGPGLTDGLPGPHAVTLTDSGLVYNYDDNGNMISRGSGDIYQWDFSNRLVQATTTDAVSTFVYDASGTRKIKKSVVNNIETTGLYVNSQYEIRDGTPVKYIFDGTRRIARIQQGQSATGSESMDQRFELGVGWNFISLNVEPENPAIADTLSTIAGSYNEVWRYDAPGGQYLGYMPGDTITDLTDMHGGYAYIIKVTAPVSLVVSGIRTTADQSLSAGWNLIPCPSDGQIGLNKALESLSGIYEAIWEYDTVSASWNSHTVGQPDFLNSLDTLIPGRSYWLKVSVPALLAFQPRQINFYHNDHLGSSSLMTDGSGVVVEETAFYPFGRPRYEERTGFDSAYKYTGKELDKITGLMYYEARYYDPVVSRFISVDPMYVEMNGIGDDRLEHFLANPSAFNLYTYTKNNPVNMIDPSGLNPTSIQLLEMEIELRQGKIEELTTQIENKQIKATQALNEWADNWLNSKKIDSRPIGRNSIIPNMAQMSIDLGSGANDNGAADLVFMAAGKGDGPPGMKQLKDEESARNQRNRSERALKNEQIGLANLEKELNQEREYLAEDQAALNALQESAREEAEHIKAGGIIIY